MTNSVNMELFTFVDTHRTTNQVSFKETMEWKNLFDKSFLDALNNNHSKDEYSNHNRDSVITHKRTVYSDTKQIVENQVSSKYDRHTSDNNQYSKTNSKSEYNRLFSSETQEIVTRSVTTGLLNSRASYGSIAAKQTLTTGKTAYQMNMNSVRQSVIAPSYARIHVALTEQGLKIFTRNNRLDKNDLIDVIQGLVKEFNHKGYAISEIKYNGKSIAL